MPWVSHSVASLGYVQCGNNLLRIKDKKLTNKNTTDGMAEKQVARLTKGNKITAGLLRPYVSLGDSLSSKVMVAGSLPSSALSLERM